jgi:hypothetical protein
VRVTRGNETSEVPVGSGRQAMRARSRREPGETPAELRNLSAQ